jgi:uncharacterized lipoprotein YajG
MMHVYQTGNKQVKNYKGVQQHMQRILEAKNRKIEDAQVFLLPS